MRVGLVWMRTRIRIRGVRIATAAATAAITIVVSVVVAVVAVAADVLQEGDDAVDEGEGVGLAARDLINAGQLHHGGLVGGVGV